MTKYYLYENTLRKHRNSFVLQGRYDDEKAAIKYADDLKDVLNDEREGRHHLHRICTIIVSTNGNATCLNDFKKGSAEQASDVIYKYRRYI